MAAKTFPLPTPALQKILESAAQRVDSKPTFKRSYRYRLEVEHLAREGHVVATEQKGSVRSK